MHVIHVVPYYYPAWAYGGIPRLVYGLSRTQRRLGVDVTVVTTDALDAESRASRPPDATDRDGVRVVTLSNLSNRLAYRHQAFLPRGLVATFRRLEATAPDIIHLHGHRHLLNNAARALALRTGVPYVFTPNGTLPAIERKVAIKAVFDRFLGRKVIDDAHALIAVSRAEVAQFRQAGVPPGRIVEIPNGLDLAEFERVPDSDIFRRRHGVHGPYVLYLGKLTPRKGVDHLVRAMVHTTHRDVILVVAGNDMGVERALRRLAHRLELEKRVRFVGLLTGEERLAALAGATLLAYPSTLEIFGLVPFEGLMAGTPAVVANDCGCGELVHKAAAGLLVPYADPARLARAIDELLDDPALRAGMVSRGRRFVRTFLSWDRIARLTLQVYESAIRETRGQDGR